MKKALVFLLVVSFYGCATVAMDQYIQSENPAVINVAGKNLPVFGVAKIASDVLPGTPLGALFDTMSMLRMDEYFAQGYIAGEAPEYYASIVRDELSRAGYEISGDGGLFGDSDNWKARFLVGGRISKAEYNVYTPGAGDFSEAGVVITWEVYDKNARKIVYKDKTSGYAKNAKAWRRPMNDFMTLAVRNSLRVFLAKEELVDFLKEYLSRQDVDDERAPVYFYKSKDEIGAEINIEEVNQAVVTINFGNGHGSGFIINPKGYVVTNNHVIEGANIIDVLLKGGKPIKARVIKTVPDKDVALLKLPGEEYDFLPLGDSSSVKVGEIVYALGTPKDLSLSNSVSKGILSGVRRDDIIGITRLQVDAAINPGNSGGALVNLKGEVLGVVASLWKDSEGIAFAISIDDVKKFLNLKEVDDK